MVYMVWTSGFSQLSWFIQFEQAVLSGYTVRQCSTVGAKNVGTNKITSQRVENKS